MSEGTHFRLDWSSPKDIAWKLVEVNVSDIVSSGGIPTNAFLNLGLSNKINSDRWILEFSSEFRKRLKKYSIVLSGGDTYYSKISNFTLTLIGKKSKYIDRSGGKAGDFIYLTGDVGLSWIGFEALKKQISSNEKIIQEGIKKHLRPNSQFFLMRELWKQYRIHAAMDVTDGMTQDTEKLAKSSNLDFVVHVDLFPNIERYLKYLSLSQILASGEELEILFLSPDQIKHKNITQIGVSKKGKGVVEFFYRGKNFLPNTRGFSHF